MKCRNCGAEIAKNLEICPYCDGETGVKVKVKNEPVRTVEVRTESEFRPFKSKKVTAFLAFFLGGFGIQYFYLGKVWKGLSCILFCATGIPSLWGMIQAIIILMDSNESFEKKYAVKVKS